MTSDPFRPTGDLHLGLVLHPTKDVTASVRTVLTWARRHDVDVVVRRGDAARAGDGVTVLDEPAFLERVDALVSLGGDGTMLGAMRLVAARPVPVLGVNHGNVGFLVEVEPPALAAALDRVELGDFVIEPHSCIEVEAPEADGGTTAGIAFNDLVLAGPEVGTAVVADLEVDGSRYGYYRCDTLVLTTPTGSTAYNYAAGGPVISPSAPVLAVTPVAPMGGVSRSIVLTAGDRIGLHAVPDGRGASVRLDGTPWSSLGPDGTLTARLREDAAQVIRIDPDRHAQRSRVKLSLLDLPLRADQLVELLPPDLRADPEKLREALRQAVTGR